MKSSKLFLIVIIIIFAYTSCKKQGSSPIVNIGACTNVHIEPALVGKWKLVGWNATHYSMTGCEQIGSNAIEVVETNVVMEITSDGIIKTYKNNDLVNENIFTKKSISASGSSVSYDLSCGQTYIVFYNGLNGVELGDTLIINNPYVDINFTTGTIRSATKEQRYVKIE